LGALGSDLKLSAAETAIFSVIAVGDYFHALNGIFRRSDDSRTAQTALVVLMPSPKHVVLSLVLPLENRGKFSVAKIPVEPPDGVGPL